MVGERSVVGRSMTETTCGRSSSENAGMSSESEVRIFTVENLRFPGEGSSAQGKSGPKARPEGVVDGEQVEIPAPTVSALMKRGHRRTGKAGSRKSRCKASRQGCSKVRIPIRRADAEASNRRSCRFHAGEKSR